VTPRNNGSKDDLYQTLAATPFPVRGWHLSVAKTTGMKGKYVIHQQGEIERNEEGIPIKVPPAMFTLDSVFLTLTADFRLEACRTLGNQPFVCPKETVDLQWIRFASMTGELEIILDAKEVPPRQEQTEYPDREQWRERVEYYGKRFQANRGDAEAKWALAQLQMVRNVANGVLHQVYLRLVNQVETKFPDYWYFAELAMAGRLTDAEIETLNDSGGGAIRVEKHKPRLVN